MDRIRFVTYRDQRILLVDVAGCSGQEIAAVADRVPEIVTREPRDSVLVVVDFTDAEFTRDAVERVKIAAALTGPISSARPGFSTRICRKHCSTPSAAFPPVSFPFSRPAKKRWTIW